MTSVGENVEELEPLCWLLMRIEDAAATLWKSLVVPQLFNIEL